MCFSGSCIRALKLKQYQHEYIENSNVCKLYEVYDTHVINLQMCGNMRNARYQQSLSEFDEDILHRKERFFFFIYVFLLNLTDTHFMTFLCSIAKI